MESKSNETLSVSDVSPRGDAELAGEQSETEVRKGRLVFQFPSSDQDAALFYPSVCVCTAPCDGHCECGISCWAVKNDTAIAPTA